MTAPNPYGRRHGRDAGRISAKHQSYRDDIHFVDFIGDLHRGRAV